MQIKVKSFMIVMSIPLSAACNPGSLQHCITIAKELKAWNAPLVNDQCFDTVFDHFKNWATSFFSPQCRIHGIGSLILNTSVRKILVKSDPHSCSNIQSLKTFTYDVYFFLELCIPPHTISHSDSFRPIKVSFGVGRALFSPSTSH